MNRFFGLGVLWLLSAAVCAAGSPVQVEAQKVRAAAVAGSWYPGDAEELGAYLDSLLAIYCSANKRAIDLL